MLTTYLIVASTFPGGLALSIHQVKHADAAHVGLREAVSPDAGFISGAIGSRETVHRALVGAVVLVTAFFTMITRRHTQHILRVYRQDESVMYTAVLRDHFLRRQYLEFYPGQLVQCPPTHFFGILSPNHKIRGQKYFLFPESFTDSDGSGDSKVFRHVNSDVYSEMLGKTAPAEDLSLSTNNKQDTSSFRARYNRYKRAKAGKRTSRQ